MIHTSFHPFPSKIFGIHFQPLLPEFWLVWVEKNLVNILSAFLVSMPQKPFSRLEIYLIFVEILRVLDIQ